jgi:PAS domain-containing protein
MATAISTSYEALGQQADALKIIFESLPIAVVVADSDGRILFWNPAADDLLRSNSAAAGVPLPSISGWYARC